ncbi:MAG: hypothetical protein KKF50_02210 [Nanoarchaeota archaeon]|nr:hypothetical protein [Nanoarchaeota archaeon]
MVKNNKNWLELIKTGKTREIAWKFFIEFNNPSGVSKKMYEKTMKKYYKASKRTSWSMPNVNKTFNKWKDEEFFYSKKSPEKTKIGTTQKFTKYIFNIEPFFRYCKEKRNMEFSPSEKKFLENCFFSQTVRQEIYSLYSRDEDFLEGMLKWYVSYFVTPYSEISFEKKRLENAPEINEDGIDERVIRKILENTINNMWNYSPGITSFDSDSQIKQYYFIRKSKKKFPNPKEMPKKYSLLGKHHEEFGITRDYNDSSWEKSKETLIKELTLINRKMVNALLGARMSLRI